MSTVPSNTGLPDVGSVPEQRRATCAKAYVISQESRDEGREKWGVKNNGEALGFHEQVTFQNEFGKLI